MASSKSDDLSSEGLAGTVAGAGAATEGLVEEVLHGGAPITPITCWAQDETHCPDKFNHSIILEVNLGS
jgi:hypothetical protein